MKPYEDLGTPTQSVPTAPSHRIHQERGVHMSLSTLSSYINAGILGPMLDRTRTRFYQRPLTVATYHTTELVPPGDLAPPYVVHLPPEVGWAALGLGSCESTAVTVSQRLSAVTVPSSQRSQALSWPPGRGLEEMS